jgi:hypothetical protein
MRSSVEAIGKPRPVRWIEAVIGKLSSRCPPAGLPSPHMGDGDPTELAAVETATESVRAWGLDELDYDYDEPPATRLTPGRITGRPPASPCWYPCPTGTTPRPSATD